MNPPDEHGETLLHNAAWAGQTDTVRLLLDRGADVNCADNFGKTPLHKAAGKGHLKTATILIETGAGFDQQENIIARTPKGMRDRLRELFRINDLPTIKGALDEQGENSEAP